MKYEKTLVLLKPGVIERRIVGEIIHRFEKKGLEILALKMWKPTKAIYEQHYKEHQGKDFYDMLMTYMLSGYIIAMAIGGEGAVHACRMLTGSTNPQEAVPGSIRGDFGLSMPNNIIHASDSVASANREIKIFFTLSEIRKL